MFCTTIPTAPTAPDETAIFQCPVWASTSECRRERSAAKAAGQLPRRSQLSLFKCHLCTIHIGATYVEKEIYCYLIAAGSRILEKDRVRKTLYKHNTVVAICGGCARRYHVAEKLCVVRASDWQHASLLSIDERLKQMQHTYKQQMDAAMLGESKKATIATRRKSGGKKTPVQVATQVLGSFPVQVVLSPSTTVDVPTRAAGRVSEGVRARQTGDVSASASESLASLVTAQKQRYAALQLMQLGAAS